MPFDDLNFLQLVPEPPGQWYDIAFGIVPSISIVICTFLLCLGIFIFKGRELVVKVKQPMQIMISLAFLLPSTISYAFSNGLLPNNSPVSCYICSLWFFILGIVGWHSVMITRSLRVLILMRFHKNINPTLVTFLLLIPCIIYLSIASIPQLQFLTFWSCAWTLHGVIISLVFVGSYLALFLFTACCMFRIRRELNEAKHELISVAFNFLLMIVQLIVFLFRLHYVPAVRVMIVYLPLAAGVLYFWLVFGVVVIKIIKCDQQYFDSWTRSYHKHTSEIVTQEMLASAGMPPLTPYTRFEDKEGGAKQDPHIMVEHNITLSTEP